MSSFRATYPGSCAQCRERIVIGQEVYLSDDHAPIHVACPNEPLLFGNIDCSRKELLAKLAELLRRQDKK